MVNADRIIADIDAALRRETERQYLTFDDIENYLREVQAILDDGNVDGTVKSAANDRLGLLLEHFADKQTDEETYPI